MTIHVEWDKPTNIITCHFNESWTWPELQATLRKIGQITCEAALPVDIILDMRKSQMPPSLSSLVKGTAISDPRNTGILIIVGNLPYASLLAYVVQRTYGIGDRFFFVDTLAKAHNILLSQRQPQAYHASTRSQTANSAVHS